jgi:palmitoyltransferase ZDHHC9/14/18
MGLDRRISSQGHEKLPSQPNSPSDDIDNKTLPPIPAPKVSNHRNHEYYAGNTVFLFLGRLMNTRAEPLNLLTVFLVALPAVLFFVSSAPWLWYNVSPALPIVYGYIVFLTLSSFSHAAFSDPGMLPRNLHPHPPNPEEERDALAPGPPTTEWIMVRTFPRPSSKKMSASDAAIAEGAMATAMEVPTKYCKSCQIWRPPRCHHCRICDTCVEGQDHHCVWLNQCVGRRNYRFFFSFVGTCTIMSLLTIAFSLTHIGTFANTNAITFGQALSGNWPERLAFAVFIYAVLALPYPGALFCYHLFLMTRGETTREYLNSHKFPPKDRHRPFALPSPLANLALVLSRPRGPSYMEFKRPHVEGDMRFGHEKPVKERQREAANERVAREGRVKDLMNRFSVGGIQHQRNAANVEMEPLPPVPPTPLPAARDSKGRYNAAESMGLSGVGVNRTPR